MIAHVSIFLVLGVLFLAHVWRVLKGKGNTNAYVYVPGSAAATAQSHVEFQLRSIFYLYLATAH